MVTTRSWCASVQRVLLGAGGRCRARNLRAEASEILFSRRNPSGSVSTSSVLRRNREQKVCAGWSADIEAHHALAPGTVRARHGWIRPTASPDVNWFELEPLPNPVLLPHLPSGSVCQEFAGVAPKQAQTFSGRSGSV